MSDVSEVLFTGFEPFAHHTRNPSFDVACAAAEAYGAGASARLLPVTFEAARKFPATLGKHRMVVCLGLSSRKRVNVEHRAKNAANSVPDNAGVAGPFLLEPEGPDACRSALAAALTERLCARLGAQVGPSEDAGEYVCNALYFASLRAAEQGAPPAVFVHVPAFSPEAAKAFGIALAEAVREVLSAPPSDGERALAQSSGA